MIGVLDATDKVLGARDRGRRPVRARRSTRCSSRASASSTSRPRSTCAACAELGLESRDRAARLPARVGRQAARRGRRADRSTPRRSTCRRRVKTDAELAGIRRAQKAADAAMGVAARADPRAARRAHLRGGPRARCRTACEEHGAELPDDAIVAHGAQAASGHEPGHGADRAPASRVIVDIWPRDKASRCWADMTRTFVAGGGAPPPELRGVLGAHARVARRRLCR